MSRHTVFCDNWDSFKPQYLTAVKTGKTIGRLMPRATQAQLGYGIAVHSRPTIETRRAGE